MTAVLMAGVPVSNDEEQWPLELGLMTSRSRNKIEIWSGRQLGVFFRVIARPAWRARFTRSRA